MAKAMRRGNTRVSDANIRLHFLGAARAVTGSLHLFEVEIGGKTIRFFCDFGLDQEQPSRNHRNRLPAGMKLKDIDFGIVSHAHIDHIGAVPHAVKHGFAGMVYGTPPTCDLAGIQLPDSGYLQEQEAKRRTRRMLKRCHQEKTAESKDRDCKKEAGAMPLPLYTEAEARACLHRFQPVPFNQPFKIMDGVVVRFLPAAHLLGAAIVVMELGNGAAKRRVVFSGDLGRFDDELLPPPAIIKHADYIVCEGTYGDRLHVRRNRLRALAEIINPAYRRALVNEDGNGCGAIVMPAFAVGRVPAVLYTLSLLMAQKSIPNIPVCLDSPLAIKAKMLYLRHPQLYNPEIARLLAAGKDIFSTPRYAELDDWKQSAALDAPASEPFIVVSSSGMFNGGRSVRHVEVRGPQKNSTIIKTGHQAVGTVGYELSKPGVKSVRIGGKSVPIRATIEHMSDFSAHGDRDDLVRWLRAFEHKPRKVFLVHGEEAALLSLKDHIEKTLDYDVEVPALKQSFDLE